MADANKLTRFRLSSGKPSSFTLVELLVVVSIIGLLAALAVPVTQKAIAAGNSGKATGNLRQVGILINSYVPDNNNCLPLLVNFSPLGSNPDDFQFWQNFVRLQAGIPNRQYRDFNKDPWLPEIFYDPTIKKNKHPWGDFGGNDSIMLGFYGGTNVPAKNCAVVFGHNRGTPLAAVGSLSKKIIVASAIDLPKTSFDSSWVLQGDVFALQGEASSVPKPDARHGGRALCLFADGHVEALDTKNMTAADRRKYFLLPQNE